jgi:hypothetical protein
MKRINVMVSDEAKAIVLEFQKKTKLTTLDEAIEKFVLEKR